jgi:type IV secretory pathway VirB10-like protein
MSSRSQDRESEAPGAQAGADARRARARRRRLFAGVVSVGIHAGLLSAIMWGRAEPPPAEVPIMAVALLEGPGLENAGSPPPAAPAEPEPPKLRGLARAVEAPPVAKPLPVKEKDPVEEPEEEVVPPAPVPSAAQLASAITADSGSGAGSGSGVGAGNGAGEGGGGCNMVRWLQTKLRQDHMVQAAVAQAHQGHAIWVWNGDWVRSPGEDGNGLAALRQAIMWEVAFAPAPCRATRMRGLVVLSMNDGPGAARVAVGANDWRWTDLLGGPGGVRR